MWLLRYREAGREIGHYGSRGFTHFRLARVDGAAVLSCVEFAPGGVIGRHPAAAPQLLAVVEGSGHVSGADGRERPIRAGEAAQWDEGEEHETRTDTGLVAIVVESDSLELVCAATSAAAGEMHP